MGKPTLTSRRTQGRVDIPRLTDDAGYAAEDAKLRELRAKADAVQTTLNELRQQSVDSGQDAGLNDAARRLLAGEDVLARRAGDRRRADDLAAELKLLGRAIELQAEKVGTLGRELSRKILAELRPEYQKYVADFVEAITMAAWREQALLEFLDHITEAGIHGTFPIVCSGDFALAYHDSALWVRLKEDALDTGLLRGDEAFLQGTPLDKNFPAVLDAAGKRLRGLLGKLSG